MTKPYKKHTADRLMPMRTCDTSTLEDAIYAAAVNVEDALLTAGAIPKEDYKLLDLLSIAAPIVAEMWRQDVVQSFRIPDSKDT